MRSLVLEACLGSERGHINTRYVLDAQHLTLAHDLIENDVSAGLLGLIAHAALRVHYVCVRRS